MTREFDTTSLTHSQHRLKIHRDYLAHVFRWGWATRYIGVNKHRRVLEPGCGSDAPLAQSLMRVPGTSFRPELYVGVDINAIPYLRTRRSGTAAESTYRLYEHFNFVEEWRTLYTEYGQSFDLAVSFEVIEHMTEAHGDTYLWAINAMLPMGATLLLSTPVLGRAQARNHIREYTIDELRSKLTHCGFDVTDRFGTFASYTDVMNTLVALDEDDPRKSLVEVYDRQRQFYGDEVMACYLAPLFPDAARNNVWVCRKTFEPWKDHT